MILFNGYKNKSIESHFGDNEREKLRKHKGKENEKRMKMRKE